MSKVDLDGDDSSAQTFEVCFPVPTVPSNYSPRQQFQYPLVTVLSTSIVPSTRPHIFCYFSNMFVARTCDFVSWNDHAIVLIWDPRFPFRPSSCTRGLLPLAFFTPSTRANCFCPPIYASSPVLTQTYEAIVACRVVNVLRRDIKPKNFFVTDGCVTSPDGRKA